MYRFIWLITAAAVIALSFSVGSANACPFCSAVQVTFTEEIKTNDVAVIAALAERPKSSESTRSGADELELLKAKFKVVDVLKGEKHIKKGDTLSALYIGEAPVGKEFLVMGIEPPKTEWGAPIEVSERAKEYLHKIMKLPGSGPERLAFFQDFLEDKDPLISRDAYDEFASTPYAGLKEMKSRMHHDAFVKRLADPKTDVSHRRLYLTMLGICGTKDDLPILEKMLKSEDRAMKTGLDALVGCFLMLKGAAGLPLVQELFIKNENVEFTDQYQAIMALRFHAEEGAVIPKDKIAAALRHMLDRPKYADLVVADLARWEDWSVIDRMYTLFRDADQDSLWVREPIVNYMRACPLPKAKEYLKQFEKIDPKAVKRASGFFPIGPAKTPANGDKGSSAGKANDDEQTQNSNRAKGNSGLLRQTFKAGERVVIQANEPVAPANQAEIAMADKGSEAAGPAITDRSAIATAARKKTAAELEPAVPDTTASPESQVPGGDAPRFLVLFGAPMAVGISTATLVFFLAGGTNRGASA